MALEIGAALVLSNDDKFNESNLLLARKYIVDKFNYKVIDEKFATEGVR